MRIDSNIEWTAVRTIPPKTIGNRGFFPSKKVPTGIVEYESQIERDLFFLLEHDPSVLQYQHQPISIVYKDGEENEGKYTPDVYIQFVNSLTVLLEIKDLETASKKFEENMVKWKAAEEWCNTRNVIFSVLTENEIRTDRLSNVWFTLGSSKVHQNDTYLKKINSLIPKNGMNFNNLCLSLAEILGVEVGKSSQILCYAIYHGLVFVDHFSTKVLTSNTIIRAKIEKDQIPFRPLYEELDWNIDVQSESPINDEEKLNIGKKLEFQLIPNKYKPEVENKETIVKEWLNQPTKNSNSQWRADFCTKWKVSQATIYRWLKEYAEHGIEGLIPKHNKKGKNSSIDDTTKELIEDARRDYLTPSSTLKSAYNKLVEKSKEKNITPPCQSTFRYYVYEYTSSAELDYNKKGRKYHKSTYTPAYASFQGAIMPMQVVQFDNSSFDVFPVDSEKRLPLATPYITAAIDCYTRMITGFYLSLSASSSQSILETLVQSILPKDEYIYQFNTELDWDISGFPVLMLVDNGMDYRAKEVREFCLKYNIILEFAPIRTPRYKAFIEQWFNILRNALKEERVVGMRPLLKERLQNPDLKPENEAILTTQEIESWLTKWIVDKYHLTNPYNDNVQAPYFRFQDSINGQTEIILPFPREAPKDQWQKELMYINTLKRESRMLRNYGIVWKHLKYNNKELMKIYSHIGTGKEVDILIDKRDIRRIWVIDPNEEKPISVELASGWASTFLEIHGDLPINASAWKRTVQEFKINNIEKITPYAYKIQQSQEKRKIIVDSSIKETKRKRREKEIQKENKIKTKNINKTEIKSKNSVERDIDHEIKLSKPKSVLPNNKSIKVEIKNVKSNLENELEEKKLFLPKVKLKTGKR